MPATEAEDRPVDPRSAVEGLALAEGREEDGDALETGVAGIIYSFAIRDFAASPAALQSMLVGNDHEHGLTASRTMTITRGFSIALASAIGFAIFGAGMGYVIAIGMPDYYRTMFRIPSHAEINLPQLGVALGLTQGFVGGLILGAVIVIAVAWYNSRKASIADHIDSK